MLPRIAALTAVLTLTVAGQAVASGFRGTDRDPGPAARTDFYALTINDRLVSFSGDDSCDADSVRIRGLRPGEDLIGIDVRPADGQLYGVGRRGDSVRLYTIDPDMGWATFVAPLRNALTGEPIRLSGGEFGFDFNPAADALRIVSDSGQNLRALPSDRLVMGVQRFTGDTFVDGTLSYTPLAMTPRPTAWGIAGAAYTNPDNDPATGTTLFDIDAVRDDLVTQNPPNDGTLTAVGDLRIGVPRLFGFDVAPGNVGWATVLGGRGCGLTSLAMVDLTTGRATIVAGIGSWIPLRGLAVALPS
jgi:hypothetical protein